MSHQSSEIGSARTPLLPTSNGDHNESKCSAKRTRKYKMCLAFIACCHIIVSGVLNHKFRSKETQLLSHGAAFLRGFIEGTQDAATIESHANVGEIPGLQAFHILESAGNESKPGHDELLVLADDTGLVPSNEEDFSISDQVQPQQIRPVLQSPLVEEAPESKQDRDELVVLAVGTGLVSIGDQAQPQQIQPAYELSPLEEEPESKPGHEVLLVLADDTRLAHEDPSIDDQAQPQQIQQAPHSEQSNDELGSLTDDTGLVTGNHEDPSIGNQTQPQELQTGYESSQKEAPESTGFHVDDGVKDEHTAKRVKPIFVFHFGPMKTATTTLQRDLKWSLQSFLEEDNWHYLEGDNPLHVLDQEPDYFEQFKKYSDEYLAKGTNLIMSKEQHSVLYNHHPEMYRQLYEILKDDWEVEFVVVYRPYLEWLPSLWNEDFRLREGRGWRKDNGEWDLIEALVPFYWNWHTTNGRAYTSHILENASQFFPVKVLDMHDSRGVRTTFICDAIGHSRVPAACKESLRLDQEDKERTVNLNIGSTNDVHIDSVSMRLAAEGKINIEKFSRRDLFVAVRTFITDTLQQSPLDLPHICPSQDEYETILKFTMEKEAELLPGLARSKGRESDLRRTLAKKIQSRTFCQIDADSLFQDERWERFYSDFA